MQSEKITNTITMVTMMPEILIIPGILIVITTRVLITSVQRGFTTVRLISRVGTASGPT